MKRPLRIDFIAALPRPKTAWVCLLCGALLLGLAADHYAELEAEVAQAEAQLNRLQRQHKLLLGQQGRSDSGTRQQGAQREQNMLDAVSRNTWQPQLQAVESALNKDVAILSLNQEGAARRLRIAAEARTIDDALAFVERIRKSQRFSEVMLSGHDNHVSTGIEVLGFTVLAAW